MRSLGHAENLLNRGLALGDLSNSVRSETHHAAFDAESSELRHVRVSCDDVTELVVDGEKFVKSDTAGKAGLAAFFATLGHPHLVRGQTLQFEEIGHFLSRGLLGLALGAESPNKALGEDRVQGRADEEGLESDVDETSDRTGGVVGVEGAEDEVAREGCLDADVSGFFIADFAQEDDVGVLAEEGAESGGEGHPDFFVGLGLIDAVEVVFDRVLNGRDVH